jgi:phenylalanine-4-hydroxylase
LQITWVNYLKWHKLNLHWWTVEYGLIGTLDNPKIYGAGLLSSIRKRMVYDGWSTKLPYSIDAAHAILT